MKVMPLNKKPIQPLHHKARKELKVNSKANKHSLSYLSITVKRDRFMALGRSEMQTASFRV